MGYTNEKLKQIQFVLTLTSKLVAVNVKGRTAPRAKAGIYDRTHILMCGQTFISREGRGRTGDIATCFS